MITPSLLLGVTLLFWGWRCDLLWLAGFLAVALESARLTTVRWNLSQSDLDRIWNLCTVLFFGAAIIAFASGDGPGAVTGLLTQSNGAARLAALGKSSRSMLLVLHWMPITLFPIVVAQAYGHPAPMHWSTFSWWLRRQRTRPDPEGRLWTGGINVSWPYFAATLMAASAGSPARPFFFAGASLLLAWALWPRRSRAFPVAAWGACLLLVIALGHGGQLGMVQLRRVLEQLDSALVSQFSSTRFNPNHAQTQIGSVGRLKLSGKIVMRLTTESNAPAPSLLREASYNLFKAPIWASSRKDFSGVTSERDGTTWILWPQESATRSVTLTTLLPGGEGILAMPPGVNRLEGLPVALSTNRFGTVHAGSGPGYLQFHARYREGASTNSPFDADDLGVHPEERMAVTRIASELNLHGQPPERVAAVLAKFFADHFRYTTWLTAEHRARTNRSALAAFLLEHRAGHCEYFATATTLLLREAGIPARYAVGYSVQEKSRGTYLVRQRHGHAWCLAWIHDGWREIDNTPASWHAIEDDHASFWEPLGDFWSRTKFAFAQWRWSEGGIRKYLVWLLIPLVLLLAAQLYFKRQWNRSRPGSGAGTGRPPWPGLDSEFYRVEQALVERGFERRKGEPLSAWLRRAAAAHLIVASDLEAALALHYRLRFDPAGLEPEKRDELRRSVMAWTARNGPKP